MKIDNNNSKPTIDISQESSTFQTKENAENTKVVMKNKKAMLQM